MEKKINGRRHTLCYCANCGKERWKRTNLLKYNMYVVCSALCDSEYRKTGSWFNCGNFKCEKRIWRMPAEIKKSKSGDFFCTKRCATVVNNSRHKSGKNHPNYKNGDGSYRFRALRNYGAFCSNIACELLISGVFVPPSMLDVHHKDGSRKNNEIDNLEVLCVWCHAKITRNMELIITQV